MRTNLETKPAFKIFIVFGDCIDLRYKNAVFRKDCGWKCVDLSGEGNCKVLNHMKKKRLRTRKRFEPVDLKDEKNNIYIPFPRGKHFNIS